jgi:hypothetical protein
MNRHSLLGELVFKFALRTGGACVGDDCKKWRLRNQPPDLAKILDVIRCNPHCAVRQKGTMERGEEMFSHKSPRRMATFWPGIGKHKVKRRNRILRQEPLYRVGNLEPQHARIGEAVALDSSTGRADPTQEPLDSEEIRPRILGRKRREKRSVTAAKIHFDWRSAPVDLS